MQVTFRGDADELRGFLKRLPGMLAGRLPDETNGGVRAFWTRIGMVALAIIRDAFVVKARGGMDASGLQWHPHAESTITHRLRKAGLPSRWRAVKQLQRAYATVAKTGRGLKKLERAKKTAALSFSPVEILRDTGRLLGSLSPGLVTNPDQRFEVGPGSVTLGSNVTVEGGWNLSRIHHNGTATIPARPLWPDWDRWPEEWRGLIYAEMIDAIQDIIKRWITSRG